MRFPFPERIPFPVLGPRHQSCHKGIRLDVSLHVDEMPWPESNHLGPETSLIDMTLPEGQVVISQVETIATLDPLHVRGNCLVLALRHQQMEMVTEKAIRIDADWIPPFPLCHQVDKVLKLRIFNEQRPAILPPVHTVARLTDRQHPPSSGHQVPLARSCSSQVRCPVK